MLDSGAGTKRHARAVGDQVFHRQCDPLFFLARDALAREVADVFALLAQSRRAIALLHKGWVIQISQVQSRHDFPLKVTTASASLGREMFFLQNK